MRFAPAPEYQVFPTRERPLKPYEAAVRAAEETRSLVREVDPDAVVADILTVAGGLAAELEERPWVTLVPHVLPTPEPGLPPYSAGARLPRTQLGADALVRGPAAALAGRAARARGAERRARAGGAAAARPRARRHLAPAGPDRHLPPARVPAHRLAAVDAGHRPAAVGAAVRGHRAPARRRAAGAGGAEHLAGPRASGCSARRSRGWRTSRSGCWRPPTAARRPSRCRCPANAQAGRLALLREGDAPLRRGGLPRRPRHRGAGARERRADRRLPGRRRHGGERRPRGLGGRRASPSPAAWSRRAACAWRCGKLLSDERYGAPRERSGRLGGDARRGARLPPSAARVVRGGRGRAPGVGLEPTTYRLTADRSAD